MALAQDLSRAQLAFQVKGTSLDDFLVLRYRGREGLCQLYRFEIELASPAQTVPDFGTIVGKPATLSVNSPYGTRWFHGIVSRFEMTGETVDQSYYVAEVVPTVWLLTHRYGSRIFQKKTTKEIIAQVLEEGGIAPDRVDMGGLEKSYQPREFCVQYRETDYNFICRLMEDEGIRWYFEQTKDAHILKLADSGDYKPIAGETKLPYHAPTALNVQKEHVYQFSWDGPSALVRLF